jgi:quinol monooxygenase YgiN
MHIVQVDIHVKPEQIEPFRAATIENGQNSIQEAGILRFDFLQDKDDPAHFMLYEVYKTPADVDLHRQTAHYLKWRDTVADMLARDRVGTKYTNILPTDDGWI